MYKKSAINILKHIKTMSNHPPFKPFEEEGIPLEDQIMSWEEMIKKPYDKTEADAMTKTRIILMNGIEMNSVITSHAIDRMIEDEEIKEQLAFIRRMDSQQQQTVNWLNPADQTILETAIGYEQTAVELTANLAKNEENAYFKQVLDFALLEDFDHLFRYSEMMKRIEGKDGSDLVQGVTDVKPGRPAILHHRHPKDEMRDHFKRKDVSAKTMMNWFTIVSGEQQTELFYKSHGFMYGDRLARTLFAEIAEVEEQHVSQYEMVGDPTLTILEHITYLQLCEAYNYFSCLHTEKDERIADIWRLFLAMEMEHVRICGELLQKYEGKTILDLLGTDTIEPLIIFESNKGYINDVLDEQADWQPSNKKFVPVEKLPNDWVTYDYRNKVNKGGVPSEEVAEG